MKRFIKLIVPVIALFFLGSGNFTFNGDKAILALEDEKGKISLLESGNVDAAVFKAGVMSVSVRHHAGTYQINAATFVYIPPRGDAMFWELQFDSSGNIIQPAPVGFLKTISSVEPGARIKVDRIRFRGEENSKNYLESIVINIK